MDVRRLAALDLHGARGTARRRRLVLAEFVVAAIGILALGVWLATARPGIVAWLLAGWAAGVGLNYAVLAVHAARLSRPGRLDAELEGVDVTAELRRYGARQLWILVPFAIVALQLRGGRRQG